METLTGETPTGTPQRLHLHRKQQRKKTRREAGRSFIVPELSFTFQRNFCRRIALIKRIVRLFRSVASAMQGENFHVAC
jgi:hypothetical protein